MSIALIISHLLAFAAGSFLFYRYGKKVGQDIKSELSKLRGVANKEGDRPPH